MDEISKIWANFGVLCCSVRIPCSSVGPRYGEAKRGLGQALSTPQRSNATPQHNTVHNMEIVVFCFFLPFHYSKDLSIGIIRTYKCMKGSIPVCKVKEKLDRTSPLRRVCRWQT